LDLVEGTFWVNNLLESFIKPHSFNKMNLFYRSIMYIIDELKGVYIHKEDLLERRREGDISKGDIIPLFGHNFNQKRTTQITTF
jgi:hypothetical protein